MNSASTDASAQPLSGIRVVEMGQLIAGPFASQMLGYFGAEVVKIEPPGRGDPLRQWRVLDASGTSYWWSSLARNKKSVTVDLASEEGQGIARALLTHADVLIENFRPGRMEAWGLGPDDMRALNPDLVYTRVSGYGQDGPYAHRPGFASACEGVGGLRYLNGYPDETPVRLNLSLGDTLAGMHAVVGTLLALIARLRGRAGGQVVDVSIVESVFNMLEGVLPEYTGAGVVREPSGTTVTGIVPTNTYRCRDGRHVVIGGNGDSIFKRLMRAAGRTDMAEDPALADNRGRVQHERRIDEALADWCAQHDAAELLSLLEQADVPAGPINSIADIAADPHFTARGAFETVQSGEESRTVPALYPRLATTPGSTRWAGPALGEHTREVLGGWLDIDAARLEDWEARHII